MKKNYRVTLNKTFKNKVFTFDDFNQTNFLNFIMENFLLENTYTLLVSFGFSGNSVFYTSGKQIGLKITNYHDINFYKNIYNIIILRIDDVISEYDMSSYPNTISVMYKSLNIPQELVLENINSITVNKSILTKSEKTKIFSSKYLPLTIHNKYFGYLVEKDLKQKYINKLISNTLKYGLDLLFIFKCLDLINKSKVFVEKLKTKNNVLDKLIIDCDLQEYYYSLINFKDQNYNPNNDEVINFINKTELKILDQKGYVRLVFDINSGICLCKVIDLIVNKDNLIRKVNNFTIKIFRNKITEINRYIKLDNIKAPRFRASPVSNTNIGVLDLETFTNSNGLAQVYCIGFCTLSEQEQIKTYYLTEIGTSLNSNLLIINCINSMSEPKYHNYYWYIHNMGKFDMVFIHKCLEEFNLISKKEIYKLNTIYKDGKMLRLVIKRKINNKYVKITFVDSLNILNDSLSNLTTEFEVKTIKGIFPYSFVNENTLEYKGPTPDIKYYNNNITLEKYKKIYQTNWSLKEESLKYLKKDLLGLLEVLEKFKNKLFIEHGLDLTEGLTISRLALNKFLKYYLKDSKLPLINKINMFNFIYAGYHGGRTEVFKPYGKDLKYYDVNSLYPTVALYNMPGLKVFYLKSFIEEGLNLENLFGVFKAKVKIDNNNYLGLLPVKSNEGLIFPNGEFEGIWPSPELKFAKEQGCDIKVIEGYAFEEVPSYFNSYIKDLFELKSKTTGVEKRINKSLLNNLIGRFGLNIIKPVTKSVNSENLDFLLSTQKIKSIQEITQNTFLVNYNPLIDYTICMEHGVDYLKALTDNKNNSNIEKNIDTFDDVSVIIAAMVTSYARVFMLDVIKSILNVGGNVYYTDIDSIVTDIPLENIKPNLVGNNLGQFKFEHDIKEAYFISNKTYCLLLQNGEVVIKCKGALNKSITIDDFKTMYYKSEDITATKTTSNINLSKGSVLIEDTKILLQHDAYTKRLKCYNDKGLWVNTKPLTYNNVEKNIIPYN